MVILLESKLRLTALICYLGFIEVVTERETRKSKIPESWLKDQKEGGAVSRCRYLSRKTEVQAWNFLIGNITGIKWWWIRPQPINIVIRWVEFAAPKVKVARQLPRKLEDVLRSNGKHFVSRFGSKQGKRKHFVREVTNRKETAR
jgi:hypothetical protein